MIGCCWLADPLFKFGFGGRAYGRDEADLGRGNCNSLDEEAGPKGLGGALL